MYKTARVSRLFTVTTLAALLPLAACSQSGDTEGSSGESQPEAEGARQVIFEGYGGEYRGIWMDAIGEPFQEETGIEVIYSEGGSAEENLVKLRSTQGNPGFDVAILTSKENLVGGQDGTLLQLTEESVPNLSDVYPELRESIDDFGAVHELQPAVMMYDKEIFDSPPKSWEVMWDPEYSKGVIAWDPANILGIYQVMTAADVFGGSQENLDPGWEAMERLAPDVLATPQSSSQAVPFMEDHTATVFPYWVGRAGFYSDQYNYGYTIPEEGTYVLRGSLGVPAQAEHQDEALELINYWLSPEAQSRWSESYFVVPTVEGAQVNPTLEEHGIPGAETLASGEGLLRLPNDKLINERRGEWLERWTRTFS